MRELPGGDGLLFAFADFTRPDGSHIEGVGVMVGVNVMVGVWVGVKVGVMVGVRVTVGVKVMVGAL